MRKDAITSTYVKELAQIMEAHSLSRVKIINKDNHSEIILEKAAECTQTASYTTVPHVTADSETLVVNDSCLNVRNITSPMVAVLYTTPLPEAAPFVQVGDMVKNGDILCVLEAMKVMNELQAEEEGKIIEICVNNGDIVEFGQILFKLEPL